MARLIKKKITCNFWLKVISHCKECGSTFQGHCKKKPLPGQGISIQDTVSDARGEPHFNKRHLNGEARLISGEKLLAKKPSTYRKELTKAMEFADPEPSWLPGPQVLRKLRGEAINRDLGIDKKIDGVSSLYKMKYSGSYGAYIGQIGLDEFYCIYSTPTQIASYKSQINRVKKVCIDGTGGVA